MCQECRLLNHCLSGQGKAAKAVVALQAELLPAGQAILSTLCPVAVVVYVSLMNSSCYWLDCTTYES